MKDLFPEYDNGGALDYEKTWEDALFVFDTNVLLNLYRYRVGTRDELLALLDRIADRIWIPYHVALEFQRNRVAVIAEQVKRFSDVRQTVEKSKSTLNSELSKFKLSERHSLINSEPLLSGFEKLTQEFFEQLTTLEKDQQTISGEDKLKTRLELLFQGRVGPNIKNQAELESLHKEASDRYKFKIPPGYEDDSKDSKDFDEFTHSGLLFKKKYGDFIIWKQILAHCKAVERKSLVFITDDTKEDWWRVIELNGPKTIGPRAELIDEARREGKVEHFLMYTPSNFLKYAKDALKVKVSEDAIQEVKELALNRYRKQKQVIETAMRGREALIDWLIIKYGIVQETQRGFEVDADDTTITYILAVAHQAKILVEFYERTEELVEMAAWKSETPQDGRLVIVWIAMNPAHASSIRGGLLYRKKHKTDPRPLGVDVIIATLDDPETLTSGFFVLYELTL